MKYLSIDIEKAPEGSIIAHGVNARGVMGAGVARALRAHFGEALWSSYADYIDWNIEQGLRLIGSVHWYEVPESKTLVANCFTQETFGSDGARYASPTYVAESLREVFVRAVAEARPVYMPMIGCGLGGLDWSRDVEPIITALLEILPADVTVCLGAGLEAK